MKKVLITGLHSYIGNSFAEWVSEKEDFEVTKCSLREKDWQKHDWRGYDIVLHVAGLAHVDTRRADEATRQKYYAVNRDLTIAAASKAKREGIKQFIYMSSIIVYGNSARIGQEKIITAETDLNPANFYGDSKMQAEEGILPLGNDEFHIAIVRTPMVYGPHSKGNFPRLVKLADKTIFFPMIQNKRSMIYSKHLCEFLRLVMSQEKEGIFWPQNQEQISTSRFLYLIGKSKNKHIILVPGFTPILKWMGYMTGYVDKIFGNLTYEESLSGNRAEYCIYSLEETISQSIVE